MSVVKKIAGETLVYGLGAILPKVLNFIILAPYLTRELSTNEYGKHGIVYAFVALLMVLTTFRMETAFFRFASKDEYSIKETFSTAFISVFTITMFSFTCLLFFSDSIATSLNMPDNPEFIRYFAWIILFDALAAPAFARLRMEDRALWFSWVKIINVIVNIIIILFLLELCPLINTSYPEWIDWFYNPEKELDYVFFANLGASAVVLLVLIKEIIKDKFTFNKELFIKMVKYAAPLIIVGVAAVINNFSDRYLLSELLPGSDVGNMDASGVYNGSTKIAVLMSLFITAFNYAAEPFFFKQAEKENKDRAYAKIALAFSAVGGVIFLGILLYLDIIQYMIGESFRGAMDIVPILLLAYLVLGLFYNFSVWYKISDKTYYGAIVASLGSILLLSLDFYLIPKVGYIGAAWSILACYSFMTFLIYIIGQKKHPINYPIIKILFNIILAIGIYFLSGFINRGVENYSITFILNSGLFLSYLIIVYKLEWKEIVS